MKTIRIIITYFIEHKILYFRRLRVILRR